MRTAAIFSDHMVLQREKPIKVWGDGADGRRVTVTIAGHSASDTVRDGKWCVTLPPMSAADGLIMTICSGAVQIVYREIAVGEVWLCGGQSNMEFEIKDELNGQKTLDSLSPECGVRFYYTPKQRMIDSDFERNERLSVWNMASPEQARAWSAVGLYFALEISQKLGVTVGLIGCNWGGTSASAWVSRDVLESDAALRLYLADYDAAAAGKTPEEMIAEYDAYAAKQEKWWADYSALLAARPDIAWQDAIAIVGESHYPGPMGVKHENRPSGLYETMLQRVCPYTLRGFLYYQGESDDHRSENYEALLSALIACWRRDWEDDSLPFLNVQLPMFRAANTPDSKNWCRIREAQANVYRRLRNTGLAVLTDCGEYDNIHPKDKATVGHRLALQALCEVYDRTPREQASAPMFSMGYAMGNSFVIRTIHAADGFHVDGEAVGFALAGADGVYYPSEAVFSPDCIVLTAKDVSAPKFARYAWTNYMKVTVFGKNGLPLAPFRTDHVSLAADQTAFQQDTVE